MQTINQLNKYYDSLQTHYTELLSLYPKSLLDIKLVRKLMHQSALLLVLRSSIKKSNVSPLSLEIFKSEKN